MENSKAYVLGIREVDKTKLAIVGGKGVNLGELCRVDEVRVPDGFCIIADAFKEIIGGEGEFNSLLDELEALTTDRKVIIEVCAKIRMFIERIPIPGKLEDEISRHLAGLGEKAAYAVRSSATAEDLPAASFAGQQDSYLNIVGKDAILGHISRCWASLFTERAVIYRMQNGFDHRSIYLAVVVQKMVVPQAAGIMFTADPFTSNRKVVSIDAAPGLGDALVSGRVNADNYKVTNGKISAREIGAGGERQPIRTLTDDQILQLAALGRKIERHFAYPQDIEWCLADGQFYIVQSRPITTLYPIPEADDAENHVYVSVGHQQMMTDAMKPLGLSFFLLVTNAPMRTAGGRLFVDITPMLAATATREMILQVIGKSEPLIKDALSTILQRGNFIRLLPDGGQEPDGGKRSAPAPQAKYDTLDEYDPAIVPDLIRSRQASRAELEINIRTKSGPDLIKFIMEDMERLKKSLADPGSFAVFTTAMNASSWVNEKMKEWLNEKAVADTLAQSVPNNITSEMGLALLDVADAIRPYPAIVNYFQESKEDNFLDRLTRFDGGEEVRKGILDYLHKYGMRCAGEIDITRPRWSERPLTIVPLILSNIKNFEPGESKRKFGRGLEEALKMESRLSERLMQLPDGERKTAETRRMINLIRQYSGYREYPKYDIVCHYFIYKLALLNEAEELVRANILHEKEDIYYLTLEELLDVLSRRSADLQVISNRRGQYRSFEKLTPPRVITSDGEIVTGKYNKQNIPAGSIIGLPVSSGMTEGRAKVILRMEDADLETGDILVTRFTDPSWTPLFVSIKGLVTEVGGLMTHGAVIAREYGIPAVVAVENATGLIRNGQRIRVHGTEGYVEILD